MNTRSFIVDALKGRGFRSCGFADQMQREGLADFTGNQHNPDWAWRQSALAEMTDDQLLELYKRAAQ